MSISCQINQKHFSVQLLLSPRPSIHPSILVITPSCSQFTATDNSELPAAILWWTQPPSLFYSFPSAPEPVVQNREILCSCWEETASTRRSCCPSRTSASPSPAPVSWPADPCLLSSRCRVDSERPPDVLIVHFSFSSLTSQLTWRSAVKTRWWGWCPAGSLSAGCLSATGYWTTRSCRPSNWTTWKISVSITDRSKTGNTRWTNVASWIDLNFFFSQNQYRVENLDTNHRYLELYRKFPTWMDLFLSFLLTHCGRCWIKLHESALLCGVELSVFFFSPCVLRCVNLYDHLFWRTI